MEILSVRQVLGSGLYLHLTRRCPLTCAHCSTNSTLQSEEHEADLFRRIVGSFTPDDRPEILALTGGEPLLRAQLVQDLTEAAHAVGTRVALATGMFWARQPEPPPAIERALRAVDHVGASLDIFHEREVSRPAVFRGLRRLIDWGTQVSVHVVGMDEHDPYLADVTDDIRRTFDDQVPILVGFVDSVGRATDWLPEKASGVSPADTLPCDLAAWPVVCYDGTVAACAVLGTPDSEDRPGPPHLTMGNAAVETWTEIREWHTRSPMLRAIRTFGPEYIARHYGEGEVKCDGFCSTCLRLSDAPQIAVRVRHDAARPAMAAGEHLMSMMQREYFVDRHAPAGYASLALLGFSGDTCALRPAHQPLTAL